MSPKSKRNRPNISRNKTRGNGTGEVTSAIINQKENIKTANPRTNYTASMKDAPPVTADLSYVTQEIKWTGIVTLIILILLIGAYLLLK
jgi:hypothetical protein